MILREELLKEKIHSREHAMAISEFAVQSAKNLKQLMQCFLDKETRVAQRAAWSVSWAARKKPEMIQPYIKDLVAQLERKDVHPAIIRNSVRVLEAIDIPEAFHGDVMNACFSFIEAPATPVAIKAFSLTTLFNLTKSYPEIKHELRVLIEENMSHETAAFKSRAKKILPKL